jgi:hypothetical protein
MYPDFCFLVECRIYLRQLFHRELWMLHALRDHLSVREQIQPLQIVRPQPGPLK